MAKQEITAEEVATAEAALAKAKTKKGADTSTQQQEVAELRTAFRRQEEEAGRRASLVTVEES